MRNRTSNRRFTKLIKPHLSQPARANGAIWGYNLINRSRGSAIHAALGQGFPQRLRRPPHLRHVRLVLGVRCIQIDSAEGAIFLPVHAHEASAAAAQAQGNRDATAVSHG